jgi:hypothetical protein
MKYLFCLILTSWASLASAADFGSPVPLDQRVAALEQRVAELERRLGLPVAQTPGPLQRAAPVTYTLVGGQLVRSDAAGEGCYTDASGNTVCPTAGAARYVPAARTGPIRRILGR